MGQLCMVWCGGGEWKQEAKWIVVLTFWYLWHYFDGALSRLQFIGWHFDSNTIAYSLPCCADNIVTTIGSSIFVCVWATHDSSYRTLQRYKMRKITEIPNRCTKGKLELCILCSLPYWINSFRPFVSLSGSLFSFFVCILGELCFLLNLIHEICRMFYWK